MAVRIAELSRRRVAERLVGRDEQRDALGQLLGSDPPALVAFLHGIAGIGKTALLSAFALDAEQQGAQVIELDCVTIEPTERGLLEALGTRLSLEQPTLPEVIAAYEARPGPVVIALDGYEVFRLLDTWLRQDFAPALPAHVRLICAGREPPLAAWMTTPDLDGVVATYSLGPLDDDEAIRLFDELGVDGSPAQRLNRVVRGHPLAIKLAAATVRDGSEPALEDVAAHEAVDTLARIFLADVLHPSTRAALEAGSVLRRVTRSLLRAMLGEDDGAFELLAELPFVEPRADGLVIHDAVRDAVAAVLRGTDPERYRAYRREAWRQLRAEVGQASQSELWRYTADMLYIIENPIVREAFFPSAMQPLAVEAARPGDAEAILRIAKRHEGDEVVRLIREWWDEAPETFSVARNRDGEVTAFFLLLDNATMLPPAVPQDPVVRQWIEHLRADGIPRGERVLGLRRWLDVDHGEGPCASQAACWLDVKRTYMALRPDLRRIYVTVQDVPTYWPAVEKLGFRPVSEIAAEIGGEAYASVFLDFGPGSVDGWLGGLVAAELGLEPAIRLDESSHEVILDGTPTALTPLEFGVLRVLERAGGRVVSRRELLRAVWETDYTGGSNVVDAVVHSLREKLGAHAAALETVRGVGYRLRAG
jgi:Transcriptional regulatory protein, C terminal/AAA ATPase domain